MALQLGAVGPIAYRGFDGGDGLGLEVGIADLIGTGAAVRTIGKELDLRWRAAIAGKGQGIEELIVRFPEQA